MARGSLRKRGNTWTLTYDAPRGPDGRRKRRYETFKGNKRQAERRLRELLSLVDKGHFVEPSKVPLKDYLQHWLNNHVAINNSPRTHEGYRSIARRHVVPSLGRIPLVQITPADVQAY